MRSLPFCLLAAVSLLALRPVAVAQSGEQPVTVVNSATFEARDALSPLTLATAFGEFPGATEAAPAGEPVTSLGNVQVLLGGTPAPLLYTSPNQINFIVPATAKTGNQSLVVLVNDAQVASTTLLIERSAPAIFRQGSGENRVPVVFNEDGTLNSESNRASRGSSITVYVTGLGSDPKPGSTGAVVGLNRADATSVEPYGSVPGIWSIRFALPNAEDLTDQTPMAIYSGTGASETAGIWLQ